MFYEAVLEYSIRLRLDEFKTDFEEIQRVWKKFRKEIRYLTYQTDRH